MEYKVEVDESKAARIWTNAEGAGEPVILQEKQPDGADWSSEAEAEAWAISEAEKMKANAEAAELELAELAALATAETPVEETPPTE